MGTCPNCGAANEAGVNFCGDCGTPLQQKTPPTPSQPPAAPGWQPAPGPAQYTPPPAPQPPQPQYPAQPYPQQHQPFPGQQPVYPQQQYPPQQAWQPAPPPKSGMGIGLKILLSLVGVLVAGFLALVVIGAMLPDEEPAANTDDKPAATTTTTTTTPTTPPASNTPTTPPQPANNNPLGVDFKPMVAGGTFPGAKLVAKGKADLAFQSYDRFGPNEILLGRSGGMGVEAMVYEFRDGVFKPALQVTHQLGGIRDVSYGDMYNSGSLRAVIMAEKGLMLMDPDGKYRTIEATSVVRTNIGDWDGDGKIETAFIHDNNGKLQAEVWRYSADGKTDEKLGQFDVPNYPESPATTYLTNNKRKLMLGLESTDPPGQLGLALWSLDPAKGFTKFSSVPVKNTEQDAVISYGAGVIAEKASLVVSYKSATSYVEVFDLTVAGLPSRGKVTLPDNGAWTVVLGYFTQTDKLEIAAFNAQSGDYVVIGF